MRMLSTVGAAALLLPTLASAQFPVDVHDGAAPDFRARAGLPWGNQGWIFTRYAFDKQGNGIGPGGISGLEVITTDENCATPESNQIALFEQDPALAPGSPGTVPDPNGAVVVSSIFQNPPGSGVCGWIHTITFPQPYTGVRTGDLFVGAFLDLGTGWGGDGPSGQNSAIDPVYATTPEFPNASANAVTRDEIDREYGFYMLGSTGPTLIPSSVVWTASPPQIMMNRLIYDHATWAGVSDPTGLFASLSPAPVNPDNFGWAGDYPDLNNTSGLGPTARADDLIWKGRHDGLGGATTAGLILLATSLARSTTGGQPLNLGYGVLELDPLDPLFTATIGGAIPGLSVSGVQAGEEVYALAAGLLPSFTRNLLHQLQVDLYCQEARVDLASGQISLGSLDSHSFRN